MKNSSEYTWGACNRPRQLHESDPSEPSSGRCGGFHRPCSYRRVYPSEAPSARLRTARMFSRVDYLELAALHMHDGPDGRHDLYMWSTQPAKTCVRRIEGISQSGRRRSGLARRASARWSISRCLCRLTFRVISTCTSLVAQLHLEYTWSTHNRQRHLPKISQTIEPTLWRVSSAARNSLPLFPGISDPALPRLSLRPCRLLRHRRPRPLVVRVGLVVGLP